MVSEAPYKMKDDIQIRDKNGFLIDKFVVLNNDQEVLIANLAFAAGRKAERERCLESAIKGILKHGKKFGESKDVKP